MKVNYEIEEFKEDFLTRMSSEPRGRRDIGRIKKEQRRMDILYDQKSEDVCLNQAARPHASGINLPVHKPWKIMQ